MKNLTELVFVVDRSGSMHPLTQDTIGGFNSMLEKQKKEEGTAYVTTVFFSSETDTAHDRVPIHLVPTLTEHEYQPGGMTALLDAVGKTISHIDNVHHYIRPEDVPTRTLFVIITDGYENSSRKYTYSKIKGMIAEHEKKGWEFLFLAANIDAAQAAESIGIRRDRSARYEASPEGTDVMYCMLSDMVTSARKRRDIDEDFQQKKKKIEK